MIIGVVASIATMGAALPMLSSGILATQLAGGAMMAGGVLSGVGTVTGNKKLSKIGGILSLAGGVGGFLSGTEAAAGLGGAFGPGSGSQAIAEMSSNFMQSVNETVGSNLFKVGSAAGGLAEQGASEVAQAMPVDMSGPTMIDGGAAAADAGTIPLTGGADNPLVVDIAGNSQTGAVPKPGGTIPLETGNVTIGPPGSPYGQNMASGADNLIKGPAEGKGLTGWIKDNPELSKIGAKAIAGAVDSWLEPDKQATVDAMTSKYNAEAAYLGTKNAELTQQLANAGKQVAMLDVNDPELERKVADAAKKGIPIIYTPGNIGQGGVQVGTGLISRTAFGQVPQVPAGMSPQGPTANWGSPGQRVPLNSPR